MTASQAASCSASSTIASLSSVGPVRVAEFLYGARNDITAADTWGAVRDVLDALDTE